MTTTMTTTTTTDLDRASTMETAQLIELARGGDESAVERIYARHWDMCVKAAYRRLGDMHLAEDAAQESLLAALTTLDSLHDPRAFPGWIRMIVRRQSARQRRPTEGELLDEPVDPAPGTATAVERDQEMAVVHTAISALSEPLRGVTRLFYLNELSQAEICQALCIPLTTVKKRLHDARAGLRRQMDTREEAIERIRNDGHPWKTVLDQTITKLTENRLVHRQFVDAFNRGDTAIVEELIDDGFVIGDLSGVEATDPRGATMRMARARGDTGQGLRSRMIDCVAQADRVIHWSVNYPGERCFVFRIRHGKVATIIAVNG